MGKIFKWVVAGAVLGGGILVADMVYMNFISPRLPLDWSTPSAANQKPYYVRALALGLVSITVVALGAPLLGLSEKSPIKAEKAPI